MTSCHLFTGSGAANTVQSLCAPVAAGSNWAVRWTPTAGFPRVDVFWMPIQGGVKLGAPQPRDPNTTYIAEEDGFLHGTVNIVQEGPIPPRTIIRLSRAPPRICGQPATGSAPAGAIFLPVPRGTAYQAPGYRDITDAKTSLNWTPLTPA